LSTDYRKEIVFARVNSTAGALMEAPLLKVQELDPVQIGKEGACREKAVGGIGTLLRDPNSVFVDAKKLDATRGQKQNDIPKAPIV